MKDMPTDRAIDVLRELLRLYDWRFEIAARERALKEIPITKAATEQWNVEQKGVHGDLLRYGREKAAAWERARKVIEAESAGAEENVMQARVREWHEKFGVTVGNTVAMRRASLRAELIREEAAETVDAIERGDLVEAIDGMCDLLYVTFGTAVEFGVNLQPFFNEVHRTNMLKVGGATRADGKILKPEGWKPPRIAEILATVAAPSESAPAVGRCEDCGAPQDYALNGTLQTVCYQCAHPDAAPADPQPERVPICGFVSLSGPHMEPLACGYAPHTEGPHSWATLPTFGAQARTLTAEQLHILWQFAENRADELFADRPSYRPANEFAAAQPEAPSVPFYPVVLIPEVDFRDHGLPTCNAEFTQSEIGYAPMPDSYSGPSCCEMPKGHAGAHCDASMAGRIAWMTPAEVEAMDHPTTEKEGEPR